MYPDQSNNPYGFIMDPQQPQKRRMPSLPGLGGGNSFIMRIALIVGAGLGLLILMTVVTNMFFSSKVNIEDLAGLTQTETELSRVALQVTAESDQAVKNAAANTRLAVESHKQTWLTFLADRGRTMGDKELQLKASTETDSKLATAKQTGTFDTVFTETMRSQLTAYAASIKAAYDAAGNADERKKLSDHYAEVQLLLKQWPER